MAKGSRSFARRAAWLVPAAFLISLGTLSGCRGGGNPTGPAAVDEAIWILDSAFTLDEYPFETAACTEVFPEGSSSVESVPADAAVYLRIRSISCYHVRVRVVNADSDTVRTFEERFGIFNRTDAEKNRGVVGFVAWDGKDDQGKPSPTGRYLWRIEFDFGYGRIRKFKTVFDLP